MPNTAKESLQEIFEKNYNIFLQIEINGHQFEIMPIQKDIPIIERVFYDEESDQLNIDFHSKFSNFQIKEINRYISYILSENEEITGFIIHYVKELVKDSSGKKLKNKLERNHLKNKSQSIKEVIKENINKRNLQSIKDFLLSETNQLEYI